MKNLFLAVFIYLWGIQLFSQGNDEEFNAYIKNDPRIEKTILPIGDGITICRKL